MAIYQIRNSPFWVWSAVCPLRQAQRKKGLHRSSLLSRTSDPFFWENSLSKPYLYRDIPSSIVKFRKFISAVNLSASLLTYHNDVEVVHKETSTSFHHTIYHYMRLPHHRISTINQHSRSTSIATRFCYPRAYDKLSIRGDKIKEQVWSVQSTYPQHKIGDVLLMILLPTTHSRLSSQLYARRNTYTLAYVLFSYNI